METVQRTAGDARSATLLYAVQRAAVLAALWSDGQKGAVRKALGAGSRKRVRPGAAVVLAAIACCTYATLEEGERAEFVRMLVELGADSL